MWREFRRQQHSGYAPEVQLKLVIEHLRQLEKPNLIAEELLLTVDQIQSVIKILEQLAPVFQSTIRTKDITFVTHARAELGLSPIPDRSQDQRPPTQARRQ